MKRLSSFQANGRGERGRGEKRGEDRGEERTGGRRAGKRRDLDGF